jgi:dTDP-4-amino-4,6-dideoxygalactose transaminase
VRTSFNLDPASLGEAIAAIEREGRLAPRAVIPVDLFGLPADYRTVLPTARARGLFALQDAAQSFGARWCGEPAGSQDNAAATSFYPTKPLGAYGDGGAVLTNDDRLADEVRSLRLHGQRLEGAGCEHRRVGLNSRLDSLQAAILPVKLTVLDEELERRAALAARYDGALSDCVEVPGSSPEARSAWAQYTLRVAGRDRLGSRPARAGYPPSAVYYRTPLNRQPAYRHCPSSPRGLPVAEALAETVLSLPIYPDLKEADQTRVIDAIRRLIGKKGLIASLSEPT